MTITTILKQFDEDRHWSLYLATVSNPFTESLTFEQFLQRAKTPQPKPQQATEKNEIGLSKKQVQKELIKAQKMLSGFVPPQKGGG